MRQNVGIHPNTFIYDLPRYIIGSFVLFYLCAFNLTPESLAASMSVLTPGPRANCQPRRVLQSLKFLIALKDQT